MGDKTQALKEENPRIEGTGGQEKEGDMTMMMIDLSMNKLSK